MNTLPSSSSKIVVDKFDVSPKVLFLNRPEPRVLRSHKVADFGFFHSIYVQHRAIHPVVARLSSETQVLSVSIISLLFLFFFFFVFRDLFFLLLLLLAAAEQRNTLFVSLFLMINFQAVFKMYL
jgi:hypothetical protein